MSKKSFLPDVLRFCLFKSPLLLLACCAMSAYAQTTVNGEVAVTMTLTGSCTIDGTAPTAGASLGSIDFGTEPTLFTSKDADLVGSISTGLVVNCSGATNPTLSVLQGVNDASATGGHDYAMANASSYISYDLFTDAGRAAGITKGAAFFTSANNGSDETVHIYARAFGGSALAAGSYTDTLTVQLEF